MKLKIQQLNECSFLSDSDNYNFIIYNETTNTTTECKGNHIYAEDQRISVDGVGEEITFMCEVETK